jgi:glyoxylase-like metal-dependent hydrolase (beta-lactamase superfamily II)
MKVLLLNRNDTVYSSNAYLALGTWSRLEDVNTLIDVGNDRSIFDAIERAPTGVGKKRVDQVILTHNHFDHTGNLLEIIERYHPKVYAFTEGSYVDELLSDGQFIRIADRTCQIIHAPGHSSDSICVYSPEDATLFSGDTSLRILSIGGTYPLEFIRTLELINSLKIRHLFPGHENPINKGIAEMISMTLKNIKTAHLLCF